LLLYSYENKKKPKGHPKNLVSYIHLGGFSDGRFHYFPDANALNWNIFLEKQPKFLVSV